MKHMRQPSVGGVPEYNDHNLQSTAKRQAAFDTPENDVYIDMLVKQGFARQEAEHLVYMREHLYENPEIIQRMAEDSHLLFARWLYEHGEIHEN